MRDYSIMSYYCFLTYALFDINEKSISTLKNEILKYDLLTPFIVATLSERPTKGIML